MNENKGRPEKIDMDDVLGGAADSETPDVEWIDPATGRPEGPTRAAVEELKAERDKYQDLWTRARADFENLRKRTERERAEESVRAGAALALDLLPVLDNLDRALASAPAGDPFTEGVALIQRQLKEALTRAGLEPIEALGETFNPVFHEAVVTERTSRFEANRILDEIQKGYKFRGRVLRPSLVKVSVRPDGQAAAGASDRDEDATQHEEPRD